MKKSGEQSAIFNLLDHARYLIHITDSQIKAISDDTKEPEIMAEALRAHRASQTSLFETQKRLEGFQDLSLIDDLTGLPNRRGFITSLAERMRQIAEANDGGEIAVVFIDLDGFKDVNDKFGHEAGDGALRQVAERLQHTFLRKTDAIMRGREAGVLRKDSIGRYGGDEMVLLLSYDENRHFDEHAVRQKIRNALDGLVFWKENTPYPVGTSIGINVFGRDTLAALHGTEHDKIAAVLKKADESMYDDKAGKPARQEAARQQAIENRTGLSPEIS